MSETIVKKLIRKFMNRNTACNYRHDGPLVCVLDVLVPFHVLAGPLRCVFSQDTKN